MVKTVGAPLKSPKCLPLFWDGSTLIWTPHQTHSFLTVLAIGTLTTSVTYSQNYPSYFQPAWHQKLLALLITETQPCILNTNRFIHKCPGLGIPGIVWHFHKVIKACGFHCQGSSVTQGGCCHFSHHILIPGNRKEEEREGNRICPCWLHFHLGAFWKSYPPASTWPHLAMRNSGVIVFS